MVKHCAAISLRNLTKHCKQALQRPLQHCQIHDALCKPSNMSSRLRMCTHLVLDHLGSLCKAESAGGLLDTGGCRADVCNHHCLGVAAQGILHLNMCQARQTLQDVASGLCQMSCIIVLPGDCIHSVPTVTSSEPDAAVCRGDVMLCCATLCYVDICCANMM